MSIEEYGTEEQASGSKYSVVIPFSFLSSWALIINFQLLWARGPCGIHSRYETIHGDACIVRALGRESDAQFLRSVTISPLILELHLPYRSCPDTITPRHPGNATTHHHHPETRTPKMHNAASCPLGLTPCSKFLSIPPSPSDQQPRSRRSAHCQKRKHHNALNILSQETPARWHRLGDARRVAITRSDCAVVKIGRERNYSVESSGSSFRPLAPRVQQRNKTFPPAFAAKCLRHVTVSSPSSLERVSFNAALGALPPWLAIAAPVDHASQSQDLGRRHEGW